MKADPIAVNLAPSGRRHEARDRRVGILALSVLVGALGGGALVRLPPLLVVGAVAGLGAATIVMLRPFVGMVFYLIIFIVRPQELYPVLEVLRLERVIGTLTLVALVMKNIREAHTLVLDTSAETKWLFGFVAASVLSIPMSYWPSHALELWFELLKIVGLYVMTVQLIDSKSKLRLVITVYCALILYIAGSSLQRYYSGAFKFRMGIERAVGATTESNDPNHLGATLACTFPLFLLIALRDDRPWRRVLALAGAGVGVWTMALTGSRSALVGFVVALGYLCWTSRRRWVFAALAVGALVGGYSVLPEQYRQRYDSSQELDDSSQSRIAVWKTGLSMFADRPIAGVGLGCFSSANAAYTGSWLQPHSLYVQALAEIGLVGSIPFFAFLFQFMRRTRAGRKKLGEDPTWSFERTALDGILGGGLVLLAAGIFGHSMLRRTWYFYAAISVVVWRLHHEEMSRRLLVSPPGNESNV